MPDYTIGQKVSYRNNSEKQKIIKELNRSNLDLDKRYDKVVPKGSYLTNTGKLMKKQNKYDAELIETSRGTELITYSKNTPGLSKRLSSYVAKQNIQQTPRDVVFNSEGGAVSKAFDLQTPEERARTSKVSSQFVSEKGEYKYKGGNDELVSTGTNFRFNTDSTGGVSNSAPSYKEVSKEMPGYLKRSEEVYGKKDIYSQLESYSGGEGVKSSRSPTQSGFYEAKRFGAGILSAPVLIVTRPGQFLKGIGSMFTTAPKESFSQIGTSLKSDTSFFIGQQAGFYGTFKGAGLGGGLAKNVYVSTGSKFVKPEAVFDVGVLGGKTSFPLSKSIPESLREFSKSNKVVTASPQKISGTKAGAGLKGKLGLEDPVIYVTPKGRGSPKFTGVESYGKEFTINPVKSIKQSISFPTVTEFTVKGVRLQPRSVVSQPGFSATRTFFEREGSKSGYAFITKRSELGQGTIKRQSFPALTNFKSPFEGGQTVIRKSRAIKTTEIKIGDLIREAGTSELEAGIGIGSEFRYTPRSFIGRVKGFESYTKLNGKNIPIREAELLSKERVPFKVDYAKLTESPRGSRIISGKRVASESSSVYSSRLYSPLSSFKYLPRYSSSPVSSRFSSVSKGSSVSSPKSSISRLSSFTSKGSSIIKPSSITSSVSKGVSRKGSMFSSSIIPSGGSSIIGTSYSKLPPVTSPPRPDKKNNVVGIPKFFKASKSPDRFKSKYAPSLEAAFFDIKSKKIDYGLARTGLSLRPVRG